MRRRIMSLLVATVVFCTAVLQSGPGQAAVCGKQGLRSRIYGGNDTTPGEWPWHAILSIDGKPECGGNLISEKWVLTAAHCFGDSQDNKKDPTLWRVHLGVTKMGYTPEESTAVTIEPSRIVIHNGYTSYTEGYDIALMELSQPVNLTRFISPICLPESTHRFHFRSTCYATGLEDVPDDVPLESKRSLKKVAQTLIGRRTCNCIYNTHIRPGVFSPAKPGMLCIVDPFGKKGPCRGDSGGPVVCNEDGVWFLAGVISFAEGCHLKDIPTIVTSASFYQDWIQKWTDSSVTFSPQLINVTDDVDNDNCSDLLSNLTTGCGFSDVDTSGSVSPGPWPWQVDLWKNDQRACGGALISTNWAITAAKCFVGPDSSDSPSDWLVTMASGTQAKYTVQKISIHGNYITPEQGYNVALVRLTLPAPIGTYTQPICVPYSSHKITRNSSCWLIGSDGHQPDQSSQGVKMDLVGPNQCNCIYSQSSSHNSGVSILPGMICATRQESMGKCLIDIGGPLACKESNTWFLIGVQSFGGDCGTSVPEVFTDITQYQSWISRETRDALFRSQPNTQPAELDTDRCSINSLQGCGRSVTSPGPVGDATDKTWPWQVSLRRYESHLCSGVLIAETWLLIAAHCIPRYNSISEYTVSLSTQLLNGPNPQQVTRKIKRVVYHPGYMTRTGENDLALVEMFYGITFSDYILPICLPPDQSLLPPSRCWVTGWGKLYPSDSISSSPPLRHLEISLFEAKNCGAQGGITESEGQLCAAAKRDNTLTCLMDSSAPLVCQPKSGGPWFLLGMFSQSSPPKKNSCPGNFTAVIPNLSWIREVIPKKDLSYLESNKTISDAGGNDSVPSANMTPAPPLQPNTTLIPHTANTTPVDDSSKTEGSCPCPVTKDGVTCAGHVTPTPYNISSSTKDVNRQINSTGSSPTTSSGAESLWWSCSAHCLLLLLSLGLCASGHSETGSRAAEL
ncbi:serine protease 53-like [Anomaloglossus baeobatrachus]|uniref:serine protease 53-like n=1 Tax=Anomaloglossus baeobatrachus TaxID=238106 RepID=UPI003F4F97F2